MNVHRHHGQLRPAKKQKPVWSGCFGGRSTKMSQPSEDRPGVTAPFSVQKRSVESFEELAQVVQTARTQVTQVDRGHLQGTLAHYQIGDLPLDLGAFSLGVRSRG